MRNSTPSFPIAKSKALIILYFFPSLFAVLRNKYLANNIPVIEPNHIPSQQAPVATQSAYQKSPYAFIRPKPDPTIRIVPGTMQVYATKKMRQSAIGPSHRCSLNQLRNASRTIRVMSLRMIMKIVPPITMNATMNRQSQTYHGFGRSSSSSES